MSSSGLCAGKGVLIAAAHEIERAVARLRDAARHARLKALRACLLRALLHVHVDLRRDGGAVDEEFSGGVLQQAVALFRENRVHSLVVGDYRDDSIGETGYLPQRIAGLRADLGSKLLSGG